MNAANKLRNPLWRIRQTKGTNPNSGFKNVRQAEEKVRTMVFSPIQPEQMAEITNFEQTRQIMSWRIRKIQTLKVTQTFRVFF